LAESNPAHPRIPSIFALELREAAMDKKRKSKGGNDDADDHATKKRKMPSVSLDLVYLILVTSSALHIWALPLKPLGVFAGLLRDPVERECSTFNSKYQV
jgi:hypothetical protein